MSDFERYKRFLTRVCGQEVRYLSLDDASVRGVFKMLSDDESFCALNGLLQEVLNSDVCACYDSAGAENGYKAHAIGELRDALVRVRRFMRGEESDLIADSEVPSTARNDNEVKDAMDSYGMMP